MSDAAPTLAETVVMKFGGTSVADAERIKRAARADRRRAREAGNRVVAVLSARGKTTDELVAMAHEVSDAPAPARDGHAALDRRAHLVRAGGDGDQRPRPRGDLAHRLAGRASSPTPRTPRRASSRCAPTASARRSTRARSCWWPASRASSTRRRRRDHARPRRLRHHGGRAGGRARRRRLRDLHRRVGRLQRRPAHRARTRASCRVVSFEEMLEMAASGAGVLQLRSVEYARNHGVRDPLPIELRGRTGYLGR